MPFSFTVRCWATNAGRYSQAVTLSPRLLWRVFNAAIQVRVQSDFDKLPEFDETDNRKEKKRIDDIKFGPGLGSSPLSQGYMCID